MVSLKTGIKLEFPKMKYNTKIEKLLSIFSNKMERSINSDTSNSFHKKLSKTETYGWELPITEGQIDYSYYEDINRQKSHEIYVKMKERDFKMSEKSKNKPVSSINCLTI